MVESGVDLPERVAVVNKEEIDRVVVKSLSTSSWFEAAKLKAVVRKSLNTAARSRGSVTPDQLSSAL